MTAQMDLFSAIASSKKWGKATPIDSLSLSRATHRLEVSTVKIFMTSVLLFVGVLLLRTAEAYNLNCDKADACKVYCENGQYVGTMYWNGSRWSDGLRSSSNKDEVARQMVAAQGSSCR